MSAVMAGLTGRLLGGQPVKGIRVLLRPLNLTSRVVYVNISSKANMALSGYKRPPPFPYKDKTYNLLAAAFDKTSHRMNENSKVVVVDGPIAAGKSTFAKALAEELDMKYFPEPGLDRIHKNAYGQHLRDLNHLLPVSVQAFEVSDFCRNPHHPNVPAFQVATLLERYVNYYEALAHLLNTGQGVILDRSVFSDFVFMEAMFESGYINRRVRNAYREIAMYIRDDLIRPHLIIYLDVPVDVAIQRVKERGIEWEVNSPTINQKYFTSLENHYKHDFLKKMSIHSEVLLFDWSNFGDIEVVVEDIERIDFDQYDKYDEKMSDWYFPTESDWTKLRVMVTNYEPNVLITAVIPDLLDVPELNCPVEDKEKLDEVLENTPGWMYAEGYNAEMGDKNILFK